MHLEARLDLLMHDRSNDKAEDDRDDDNGQAPVAHKVGEELDTAEYPIFKRVPHTVPFYNSSGTGSYPPG